MSDSCNPMDSSLPGSSPHSLGKNTGVGCYFLLQRIVLTQESNPGLLHCRQILYQLSYEGSPPPWILEIPVLLLYLRAGRFFHKYIPVKFYQNPPDPPLDIIHFSS